MLYANPERIAGSECTRLETDVENRRIAIEELTHVFGLTTVSIQSPLSDCTLARQIVQS